MRHLPFTLFLSLLLGLALLVSPAIAQPTATARADSLLKGLRVSKPDTNDVNLLVGLGDRHVYKPLELKADLDSAYRYAKEAERLSLSGLRVGMSRASCCWSGYSWKAPGADYQRSHHRCLQVRLPRRPAGQGKPLAAAARSVHLPT